MCHLQVVTWAPQNDVLGHPRVKAFLSHCGANSMYEVNGHGCPPDTLILPTECPSLECAGVILQSPMPIYTFHVWPWCRLHTMGSPS